MMAATAPTFASTHAAPPPLAGQRVRVLIADDSAVVRGLVARWIGEAGHEVVATAANGRIAVEAMARHDPDAVMVELGGNDLLYDLGVAGAEDNLDAILTAATQGGRPVLLVGIAKPDRDEARRRAEEANLAKSRFLASMSHELRTPLNAILGFSEAMHSEMLGPIDNENYKTYVGDIHASGKHLLNLINEILDLSRVEAGKYELREEALRLTDVAEDCMALVRMKAGQKQIVIKPVFQDGLPRILADEKAVRQIMLNMLSNAVKFTPNGGLIEFKVGWTASGGQYVTVKDNGPGIPEDEIPVVLSAFGQGSIAIKSAEQGTGLGLPIVQALLAMHGGGFTLKSKLREGTEAIAMFPAARVMEVLPAEPVAENERPARRGLLRRSRAA